MLSGTRCLINQLSVMWRFWVRELFSGKKVSHHYQPKLYEVRIKRFAALQNEWLFASSLWAPHKEITCNFEHLIDG